MYKAAIFDLDGTVADTLRGITHFVNAATAHFGLGALTEDKVRYYVGDGADKLIERTLNDVGGLQRYREILDYYNMIYKADPFYQLDAFPGIIEMLDALAAAGLRLAVLSNKPQYAVAPICQKLFGDRFDVVQGHVDGLPLKPDTAGVQMICKKLDVSPQQILYVGDTKVDMLTGKGVGAFTIGVTWGFRPRRELAENGADLIVDHPDQITAHVLQNR